MLTIRKEQLEAFSRASAESFETEMVLHCQDFSPQLCKTLGEAQLQVAVRGAIERASSYGFTRRGPVRLYVEMTLLLGSAFDTDPQYPWAHQILADEAELQMHRAERLHEKTLDYLEKVVGPEDRYAVAALERIAVWARSSPTLPQADLLPLLQRETTTIYPEKAGYIGDDAIQLLLREGVAEADVQGMTTAHSRALLCVLMFAFGHGCADDPLYPWIRRTLDRDTSPDPLKRAERLERKALTWLDAVIAWHRGLQT